MPEPAAGGVCARAGVAATPTRATPTTRVVAILRKPRRGSEGARFESVGRMLVPPVEDDSTVPGRHTATAARTPSLQDATILCSVSVIRSAPSHRAPLESNRSQNWTEGHVG